MLGGLQQTAQQYEMVMNMEEKLLEMVVSLFFETGNNQFKDRIDVHKLKKGLRDFIEEQKLIESIDSFGENIDYEGLIQF